MLNKPDNQNNMDNVKLNEEEADSDDEWEGLVEASDPEADPENRQKLTTDPNFINKLRARLRSCSDQVREGGLEGASKLRTALRIVVNLFTGKW